MSLISVVIPAYKRSHVIEKALRSVLEQTYQDFEIIVVDDGSKDDTESVVASLSKEEPRIRYLCHDTNRGAQAARNTGAKAAQGEWIAFLDSDDYFTPNSLEIRFSVARKEKVKVVHSECKVLRKGKSITAYEIPALHGSVYRELLTDSGPILFSGLLIAKEAIEKVGYLDEQIISYQDWDTAIRLAKYYPFGFVPESTFVYDCRGDDTISQNMVREAEGYSQVFNKHFWEIVKQLGPRIVACHYRNIANRYQSAGNQNYARLYQILSFLWWPLRLKTICRQLFYTTVGEQMSMVTNCVTQHTRQELLDIWRHCLTEDRFIDPHEGIFDELGKYFGLSSEKVRWICENSVDITNEEWRKTGQSTPDEIYRFYQAQTYWIFGTLRRNADQAKQNLEHPAIAIALALEHLSTGHHLDFGCGAGTASLFFNALGWQTSLTDVSETAMNFVRWRFEQRGLQSAFHNFETDQLPPNTYDLITAFDVMVCVQDIPTVLHRLHQSLKPGGYLIFNIVPRNLSEPTTTQWLLYDAHYPIIRHVRQTGFRRLPNIISYYCYQKIDRSALNASAVGSVDHMIHNRFETGVRKYVRNHVRKLLLPYKEESNKIRTWLSR